MADVISFGPEDPRRPPRWLIGAGVAVLVVAGVVFVSLRERPGSSARGPVEAAPTSATTATAPAPDVPRGPPCQPVGSGQNPAVPEPVAGMRLDGAPARDGLERCDRTAADGPWTVVVRRPDGSFGRRGAVVTFPADPSVSGRSVAVGGVTGTAGTGTVTWPAAGRHARVRGDLAEADLVAIAARTRVEAGRPAVDAPPGLAVVAAGPYRAPAVHQIRYGSASVGEGAALGDGLTFTGMASGGGFEDRAYASTVRDGGPVGGRPSIVSEAFGGNGAIVWEPAPGLVAYIGYSGSLMGDDSAAALQRLAARARLMTTIQWAEAGSMVLDQTNNPG